MPPCCGYFKVPTELRKAQIDQSGEPTLGISEFMADKTPLPAQKLELLGVFFARLKGNKIAVAHSAGDKKRVVSVGLSSPQMSAGALAA